MSGDRNRVLRSLPAVGVVVEALRRTDSRARATDEKLLAFLARRLLDARRRALVQTLKRPDDLPPAAPTVDEVVRDVAEELEHWHGSSTCRVVNATGIVLHSGLGRAPWTQAALDEVSRGHPYVLLEVEKEAGRRRKRDAFCEELLCEITGAEAAIVVNNNAAATMIILNTLAARKEVVVSRSQMIEIGGSFRLPDVMEMSNCILREVGTTNKSRASDYVNAVGENTGALMLVHTSNYRIVGFTEHVEIDEMVRIGKQKGLPVIHDLGSGSFIDLVPFGVPDEPDIQASVKSGADVICFSGDKLLGGPQAGIIIGRREWIERIRKNPLARALRIDKMTAIGLEVTLKLYLEPSRILREIPALRMLSVPLETLRARAEAFAAVIREELPAYTTSVVAATSELGAGTLPTRGLPTFCVAIESREQAAKDVGYRLRMRRVPVFTRVKDERVLLDPRTMGVEDEPEVLAALRDVARANEA